MLVYSYDKKTVVDATCLTVERNPGGGKDGKFVIRGSRFATEEDAINELENAFKAFADDSSYYIF